MHSDELSELLYEIYGGVSSQGAWPRILDSLAVFLEGKAAVLVMNDFRGDTGAFDAVSRLYREADPEVFQYYLKHLAHHEKPAWEQVARRPLLKPYYDTDSGLSAEALDDLPHYRFSREKFGIRRRIAFRLNDRRIGLDAVAIAYDQHVAAVPPSVASKVAIAGPHLARTLDLARGFNLLRTRHNAVLAALNKFSLGICLVLESGEVVIANQEAERIFDAGDTVWRRSDGLLVCRQPTLGRCVRQAVERASRNASGALPEASAPVVLPRTCEGDGVFLDVTPLRDSAAEIEENLTCAMVFLVDLARPPRIDTGRFARLYDLTATEREVLDLVYRGKSVREIAERRSVSIETVRTQIKSLMIKTGYSSRIDLVRSILQILPPVL